MQDWGSCFQQTPSYPEKVRPSKEFVSFIFTHHSLVLVLMGFRHVKPTYEEVGETVRIRATQVQDFLLEAEMTSMFLIIFSRYLKC